MTYILALLLIFVRSALKDRRQLALENLASDSK